MYICWIKIIPKKKEKKRADYTETEPFMHPDVSVNVKSSQVKK